MSLGGPAIYPGIAGCMMCVLSKDRNTIFVRGEDGKMRTFTSGATRDTADGKHEPWGFMSALAEQRFCEYMTKHRTQADGGLRASDNWKLGIPVDAYKHSLSRHIQDLRLILEGYPCQARDDLEEVLCAVLFNVQGMLHEAVHARVGGGPHREESPGRGGEE